MNVDRPFKVSAVREFLSGHYPAPQHGIEEWYDEKREVQMFRVTRDGKNLYAFGASREFLDDHTAPEIAQHLGHRVIEELERQGHMIIVNDPPPPR